MKASKRKHTEPDVQAGNGVDEEVEDREDQNERADDDEEEAPEDELVDVDLDFFDPKEIDFHGLKTLLRQIFLNDADLINLSAIADAIIAQPHIGSVVKVDDGKDPYAVMTMLDISKQKEDWTKPFKKLLLQKCKQKATRERLDDVLKNKCVGFLLNERLVNMPAQIAGNMLRLTLEEMEWSLEQNKCPAYEYVIVVSKLFADAEQEADEESSAPRADEKSRKRKGPPNEILYVNVEEDIYEQNAEFSYQYSVASGSRGEEKTPVFRKVHLLKAAKLPNIQMKIQAMFDEEEVSGLYPVLDAAKRTLPLCIVASEAVRTRIASHSDRVGCKRKRSEHDDDGSDRLRTRPRGAYPLGAGRSVPLRELGWDERLEPKGVKEARPGTDPTKDVEWLANVLDQNEKKAWECQEEEGLWIGRPASDEGLAAGLKPLKVAVDISLGMDVRPKFIGSLLDLGVLPVFVFDSMTRRPECKKNQVGSARFAKLHSAVQTVLLAFRFPFFDALEEAEAECARLNELGIVDAVLSDDSDSLLFGASLVINNWATEADAVAVRKKATSKVPGSATSASTAATARGGPAKGSKSLYVASLYDAGTISSHLRLSRHGLILIALLSGSDYCHGVKAIGMTRAAELAVGGLADSIVSGCVSAACGDDEGEQQVADGKWELQRMMRTGEVRGKKISARIPDDWPDRKVVRAYMRPNLALAKDEQLIERVVGQLAGWSTADGAPDLEALRGLMEDLFPKKRREVGADGRKQRKYTDEDIWRTTVAPALRLRELRVEAHRRLTSRLVDASVIRVLEETRGAVLAAESSAPKTKKRIRAVEKIQKKAEGSRKLTEFFQQQKNTLGDLAAEGSMVVSSVSVVGDEHVAPEDSSIVEKFTGFKANRSGLELLSVQWSSTAFNRFAFNSIDGRGSSERLKVASASGEDDDMDDVAMIETGFTTAEPDGDPRIGEETTGDDTRVCWVDAGLCRIVAPSKYVEYMYTGLAGLPSSAGPRDLLSSKADAIVKQASSLRSFLEPETVPAAPSTAQTHKRAEKKSRTENWETPKVYGEQKQVNYRKKLEQERSLVNSTPERMAVNTRLATVVEANERKARVDMAPVEPPVNQRIRTVDLCASTINNIQPNSAFRGPVTPISSKSSSPSTATKRKFNAIQRRQSNPFEDHSDDVVITSVKRGSASVAGTGLKVQVDPNVVYEIPDSDDEKDAAGESPAVWSVRKTPNCGTTTPPIVETSLGLPAAPKKQRRTAPPVRAASPTRVI
ncbi:Mss4p nuclear export [Irineochytrium annulatum]|nr:Mss4p nuclear export [Irineochytrium annulatum]